jgi:hypothetical protein
MTRQSWLNIFLQFDQNLWYIFNLVKQAYVAWGGAEPILSDLDWGPTSKQVRIAELKSFEGIQRALKQKWGYLECASDVREIAELS